MEACLKKKLNGLIFDMNINGEDRAPRHLKLSAWAYTAS